MRFASRLGIRSIVLWLSLLAAPAFAAPCAGFTDVDSADPYCADITWMKNRGITLGCAITQYCPGTDVSRVAMALFMHRLGSVVVPQVAVREQVTGNVDLSATGAVLCAGPAELITGHRRTARVDGTVDMRANQLGASFYLDPVYSVDGGTNWLNANQYQHTMYMSSPAQGQAAVMSRDIALNPGDNFAFGLLISRRAGGADIVDSRCIARATVSTIALP